MNTVINNAVAAMGSQAALAKSIGVSAPFVNDLLHERKRIPAELCASIEHATRGAVTRYQLRPDVFGETPVMRKKSRVT